MKFLNNKEEVLDIEITQYGKYLLSKGQFHPDSYAFFDTEILYDSQYASLSEPQNNVHDRIKEIPQLEVQHLFHGVETEVIKINKFIKQGQSELGSKKIQPTAEKHYSLTAPIGTISLEATSAPGWSIKVLDGEISSSISFKEGEHTTLKIPQLEMKDIEYRTITKQLSLDEIQANRTDLGLLVNEFKDGSYIDVIEDSIVIDVEELNTIYGSENFEIEVFEITGDGSKEVLIPLQFVSQKPELIKNNILLDENQINTNIPPLDTSCVEYFFDIIIDDEVEDELLPTDVKRILYSSSVREEEIKDC